MKLAGISLGLSLLLQQPSAFVQAPIERRPPAKPVQPDQTSQQPVPQDNVPTITVESRLVSIAVNVVDQNGAPVGGLQQDDFELLEDGKLQKIAYFDRQSGAPLSIVLAIDGSESVLRNEALEKQAAKKFVNSLLRDQDELDLMDFSDSVREIVSFTNQKKRIDEGLNQLQRGSETALYDAIYLASDRLAQTRSDAGRRRVLVLITDGGDTAKRSRYTQALEQAQRSGTMIYSIIIVPIWADAGRNTGGEHALVQMSNDTGGKYFYVEDKSDLEPAFARVSDDLRTQYVLGYYAPQRSTETAFRTVKVRMKDAALRDKYNLRHRSGYYGR